MNIVARETPYFYNEGNALLQAAFVAVEGLDGCGWLEIAAEAGGKTHAASYEYSPGNCRFTVLLPSGAKCAVIKASMGADHAESEISAGGFRPWTIYVAQDKHLDYGWKHSVEDIMTRINRLTDYYIDANVKCGTRFNLDCTLWLEEYLRSRPMARTDELIRLLREGQFQMGAFASVMFNGILTEEELIHALMAARRFERDYGIPVKAVMPNEAPSMNWGMAQVLAGSGVQYIVRGAYDLNNANLKNREFYPLFWWEGPDGSRVLTKFDLYEETRSFGGYAEAYPLRVESYEERVKYIERAAKRYDGYASYPFDAILLAGTGWDEYPFTHEVTEFIGWYNAQDWAYPRLVDATWQDYFNHIEREPEKLTALPVLRGDFGSAWEEWLAQLAYINSLFRNARRLASDARALSAMTALSLGGVDKAREERLFEAYTNLCRFADHNIGGIAPYEAYDTRDRKTQWVYNAQKLAHEALEASMAEIAEQFSCGECCHLMYNPLSWSRACAVEILLMEELGQPGRYCVMDVSTGREAPCEVRTRGTQSEHYLAFVARDVPAFGCKVFRVEKIGDTPAPAHTLIAGQLALENARFRLELDSVTGGVASLVEKASGRELVDRQSSYVLNQYLYTSESSLYAVQGVKAVRRTSGPVSSSITVEGRALRSYVRTSYTIYESLDCIDIENYLEKQPTSELQTCHFVFPFAVPGREYHYDGAAAILKPGDKAQYGGDTLQGAAMSTYCGLHFADVSNGEFGVTLCSRDTHLYHFGTNTMGQTEGYIEPYNATIWSVALENFNRMDNCSNQGGQDAFIFRYRIAPHVGKFDAYRELKAGLDALHPFPIFAMGRAKKAIITGGAISFLDVRGEGIVATIKNGDEGGLILRMRNVLPRPVVAKVTVNHAVVLNVRMIDHLERESEEILARNGGFDVNVSSLGLTSIKIMTKVRCGYMKILP